MERQKPPLWGEWQIQSWLSEPESQLVFRCRSLCTYVSVITSSILRQVVNSRQEYQNHYPEPQRPSSSHQSQQNRFIRSAPAEAAAQPGKHSAEPSTINTNQAERIREAERDVLLNELGVKKPPSSAVGFLLGTNESSKFDWDRWWNEVNGCEDLATLKTSLDGSGWSLIPRLHRAGFLFLWLTDNQNMTQQMKKNTLRPQRWNSSNIMRHLYLQCSFSLQLPEHMLALKEMCWFESHLFICFTHKLSVVFHGVCASTNRFFIIHASSVRKPCIPLVCP